MIDYPFVQEARPCVSVACYLACEDTALRARLFLWHSLGLNGHFVGDGQSPDPATKEGVEEHLTGNVPLASIPSHRFNELDIR